MKKKYHISHALNVLLKTFILIAVLGATAMAATYYTYTNSDPGLVANWWTATNGTGTHPANFTTAGDIFIIQNNNTMTTTAAWSVTGTLQINNGCSLVSTAAGTNTFGVLTINGGGTLTISRVLTVNGATNITGTVNFQTTARADQFNGDVTLNSSAVWNETVAITPTFVGNFTNNATTFTASTGTHTFNGATMIISGTTATVIPSATFTGAYTNSGTLTCATLLTVTGVTLTNNGTITASTALAGSGTLSNGATGTLNIGGTSSITTLTNSGAATITGAGAISTILANFTNSGTINLNGTGTITGITNTGIVNLTSSGTIAALTNSTNGTLNISASPVPTITTLTATATGNTVVYNGVTQTVKGTTYYNLTSSASTSATLGAATTINNNLSVTTGTLADGGFQITGNATGTLGVANGATLQIGAGTATITSFPTNFTTAHITLNPTSTVNYSTITNAQNVAGSVTGAGPSTYGHLTITGASGTKTVTSAITVAGNLTIATAGETFADGGYAITVNGNVMNNATHSGAGKILMSSSNAQTIGGATNTFGNLEFNNSNASGVVFSNTTTTTSVSGNIVVSGGTLFVGSFATSLTVTGTTSVTGTLSINNATGSKTFTGDVTIISGGTFNATAVAAAINFGGNITNNGTSFDLSASTGTTSLNGATKTLGGNPLSFGLLTIGGATAINASTTVNVSGTFTINAALTNNGTLNSTGTSAIAGASSITNASGGSFSLANTSITGTIIPATSANLVTYTGTAAQTIKVPTTNPYFNLTVDKSSNTATLGGAFTVSGNLTINNGTLADGGFQITGNATGTLSVAAGATLQIGAGTATITSFPTNFTTAHITLNPTSTVNYNTITNAQNVAGSVTSVGPSTYGHLTITGASGTKTVTSAITVAGNLTIATAGETFADGGYAITVNGNVMNNATHSGAGKILMSSSNAQTIGGATNTFGNLEFNNSNASGVVFSNTTTTTSVSGNIVVSGGTLFVGSFATSLTVTGTTSVTGTLTFNNATGTRSMGAVTVNTGGVVNITTAQATPLITVSSLNINGGTWNNNTVNEPVTISTGNFTNTGTFNSGTGTYTFLGASQSINGNATTFTNITVSSTGTGLTNNITAAGGLNITTTWAGTGTFVQAANAILNIGAATVGSTTLTATATGNTADYNSTTGGQTINGTTYYNLTIDKSTQIGTLGAATTVSNNLKLNSGNIATGSYTLIVTNSAANAVSRTSGQIVGNLQRAIATGANNYTFDVGTSSSYTPVSVNFASVTTGGNLTANVTSGQEPNTGSPVDGSKDVGLYWTLTNSGIVFTTYSPTFTYNAGDIIGGSNNTGFIVGKYTASVWTSPTPVINAGSGPYTTQVSGLNSFSDFVVGPAFTSSATDYFRSIATGNWSTASNWQSSHDNINWYLATAAPTSSATQITIQSTGTITINTNNQTASSIVINSGATLTNSTTNTLIVSGSWTNNGGTFTPATGTVTFNGTTQVIGGSASTTFNNLSTSGSTNTSTGIATTIGGNLSIGDGTTFTSNATYALTVMGTTTVGGGTGGTLAISTAATNTQTFIGAVTINNGGAITESAAATLSFGSDVIINNGGALTENTTAVVGIAGSFTNNGTYTASTGVHTFSGTTKTINGTNAISIPSVTVNGTYTNNATLTVGTALAGTGTMSNSSTGTLNIGGTCSVTTLTNAGTTAISGSGAISTALANFTNTGTLNLNGTGTIAGITNSGTTNLVSSGTITALTNTGTLNISDNTVPTITTLTANTAGTVNYSGASQTINSTTYYNLTLSGSGTDVLQNNTTAINGNMTLSGTVSTTTTSNLAVGGNLNVGSGTTLTIGNFNFSVGGTASVSGPISITQNHTYTFTGAVTINNGGSITLSGTVAAVTFGSDITINSGGTLTESVAATVSVAGNFTDNGTFTANTGVHTFSGSLKTIGGTSTISIPSVTVSGTYTNNGTLTVTTALAQSGTGTLTNGAAGTININFTGTPGIPAADFIATTNGNTVNYGYAGTQTVINTNYYNLTLSNTSAKTLQTGTITISGALTLSGTASATTVVGLTVGSLVIGDGTTFTVAGFNLTVNGTTTVGGGMSGTLSITSTTGTKTFTGAVTINSGGNFTESVAEALTFSSDVTIYGTLTENGAAVVGIAGSLTNNGTYTASTGVQTFSGATKTIGGTNPISIPSVTVSGTYTNNGTLTVTTALAQSGTGTLTNGTTGTININFTGTPGIPAADFIATATGNTVNYGYAGTQTVINTNYYNLTLSNSGAKTLQTGTTAIGGNLTLSGTATTTGVVGLTIGGNVVIGSGTTFTSGAFTHNIAGDWTNNGGTFTYGTGTVVFDGTGSQNINGTAASQTFNNLTLNQTSGMSVVLACTLTVSSTLTLTSGVLTIGNYNLLLSNQAANAIAGSYSTTAMIQTSGTGYLQKAGGTGGTGIGIVYPVGSGGYYDPLDLTIGGFTATGTGNLQISATTVNQGANTLSKYWTLTISAGYSAINTKLRFTYNNAEAPGGRSLYDTWYNGGSSWVSAPGTHTALAANPFGTDTSGASAASISGKWTAGSSAPSTSNTYYSYQSGDWNNASSWTSDPSGTTLINSGVPANSDIVTILNGRTISISANTKQVNTLTVNSGGILDIGSTTGHNFGTVSGQGKIKLSSNTFPGGTYTSFVASGGGTIEFYNLNGVSIPPATPSPFTYNNLIISNNTTSAISSYFFSNNAGPITYTINGNLSVKNYSSGTQTLYFGNLTPSDSLINMTVYGDFTVDAGCNVRVNNFATAHGIPNPTAVPALPVTYSGVHTLSLYGNLVNNGSIRFTGLPSPDSSAYYILTTTAWGGTNCGDVQVFFHGATNNTVTCNGTTDFFRLIVEKGTDKTYTLEVNSSSTSNFALYAPNNQGNNQFDGQPEGFGYGAYYKALFIHYGTLKLDANINVPSLTEGGQDFNIIPTAELWVNGATVSTTLSGVNGTGYQAATLYGTLRLSGGSFSMGDAAGMVLGTLGTPVIMIEGTGTLVASQVWTSTGGTNQMSYIQTGGTANFQLLGENHAGPMFGLSNVNSSFTMSGGTINFTNNTFSGGTTDFQIMDIESQAGNYNVTGGTININVPSSATVYTANSTVPFYNVNISNRTGTGTTTVQWNTPGSSLSVLHDLTIGNLSVLNLNTSTISLNVGHNFTISSGGTYTPSTTSTTTFNSTGAQAFNNVGTITGGLNNLTITNSSLTSIINNNVIVNGALFIDQNSVLNDSGETVTVYGNIINSGTHISRVSTGAIILTGTAAQTLSGNGAGIFNNLTLNKTGGSVTATANMAVTGNLRLAGTTTGVWNILNIGSYRLALGANSMVYSDVNIGTTFNNNKMIQTSGLLSDGGVSKTYANTLAFVFPFGFYTNATYYYMPHSIQFTTAPTAYGTVTTHPVNGRHPLAQGSNNALTCYWKATSTGFTGIPASSVINIYYYDYAASNYFVAGTEGNYVPALYNGSSWSSLTTSGVNTTTNQVTYNTSIADGEYTAGDPATAFGAIPTLYSVVSGPWNNANTWSTTRGGIGGGGTPTAGTLVIICSPYTVTTPVAASSSSLTIESGSTLDLGIINGHSFGSISTGSGTLRIASSTYFPAGDWGNFLGPSGGTVEYYQAAAGTLTLPTTYTLPGGGTANITGYYNLITSPYNASNIILPNSNLTIYNNLTAGCSSGGGTSNCITQINAGASSTTIEVKGNININQYGILQYQNNLAEYVIADNDINIASGGVLQVRNGGNSVANTLTVYGNIINNGTFDLDSNYPTNDNYYCTLIFTGSLSKSLTSTSTPTRTRLYGITVNKGTSKDSILNVNVDPTGFQMGGGGLNLQNGTFRLTSNVTMPLSVGGFSIPSTACLSANGGTFNIATGAAAADLSLVGRLEIIAGAVNIGPAIASASANAFNTVYASAGTPEIIISGGSLNVYSQIRRGTGTTSGSLNYTQTGGTVTIGGKNASTSRAVFEVLNGGSKFTVSNGTIIIANDINNSSPYDLYLDPDIENVTGGTIQFGYSGVTPASTLFYFQSSCSIGNLTLEATTKSSAIQEIYPLTLVGSLTIGGTSSYYNTNGLNVTIGGNLINNNTTSTVGLNVGGYQTQVLTQSTGFVGSTDQTITGTTSPSNITNFANLDVSTAAGHSISLSSSNITINGDLTLSSGTLNDNGNTITLLNNVNNNATHYSSSTSGGMIFKGTANQGMTGSGSGIFGNIEINNSGHGVNMTDNSTINGQLKFTNGNLYIDNYSLTFGQSVIIVGASGTNHVILNGVLGDIGVTKIFPNGASSFTYPIGANGKYTPCTYNFTANTNAAGATINVIPIDDLHPSINPANYSNYLNYYWKVVTTGFSPSTYNVTHSYTYIPADVTGSPANIERCDNSTAAWTTVTPGTISSPTFSFSSTSLLDGSYTIGDQFISLPILYSTKSGNWNDATVWSPSFVPNGHSVVINAPHTVTISVNGALASSVDIEGVLDATNTVSNNIGQVSGTGKIRMSPTGSAIFIFPGGSYDLFLANLPSTVEFYGNTDGTMPLNPGNINKPYQQVIFSGTGKKYISSVDTKINGNITISDGSRLDNTLYNKDLFVLGNWIDQNTSIAGFTAGTGAVHFSGSAAQSILMSGNSMKETFYDLEINNAAGLTINTGTVDISDQLLLTLGNINFNNIANNILTITNTSSSAVVGGSDNSFVNGPLSKKIINGSSFQFPVGDANSSSRNRIGYVSVNSTSTSGTQTWTAQFFDKDPTTAGYNTTQMVSPLQSVVNNEYWNIIGPSGGSANVVLSWDQYTGMSSSASTRALTRVVEWLIPWNAVGQVVTDNGQTSGTVATSTLVNLDNHFFTIGGINIMPLLITSIASGDWSNAATWNYRVPMSIDTVHISNNFADTLNTSVTITSLIVDNGGSFDNNNSFSVTNNVYIGSGSNLKIESGASISAGKIIINEGSNYINLSSSAPTLQVMYTITGTEGWRMLAAPDSVTVSSMFAAPFVTQGFTGSSYPSLQPNLLWWDETSQGTSLQAWRMDSVAVKLGRGYMYYVFNGALRPDIASNYSDVLPLTMTATGTENLLTSAFDFGVTATPVGSNDTSKSKTFTDIDSIDGGWNLVGNPTPSTINWNAGSGWTKTNIDGTIYIWDPATSNYKYWNGSTGNITGGLITPFQAFWVKANAASPSLKCDNRVKATGGNFLGKKSAGKGTLASVSPDSAGKKSTSIAKPASLAKNTSDKKSLGINDSAPVLELELSANGLQTQAYLMFSPSGKITYDPYDAFSLVPLSDNYLILYSVAGTGQPAMQIQNLPDTGFVQPFTLPLYVGGTVGGQPFNGSFTLSWNLNGQLPVGWNIFLMDDVSGTAASMIEAGDLTFQYTTPADLISSSSSLLQKGSGVASNRQSLHALPQPVVQTVPAAKLAKSSASESRFRLVVSANNSLSGYLPATPQLAQNYPNPFNPTTNITFSIPAQTRVTIRVFNILGQQVATVTDQEYSAGNHLVVWNASNVASGVYFCRMTAAEKTQTKKMVVLK